MSGHATRRAEPVGACVRLAWMFRRCIAFALVPAGLLAFALPSASAAGTRCKDAFVTVPSLEDGTPVVSRTYYLAAYGTTCRTARKVARKYLRTHEGHNGSVRSYGYRCRPTKNNGVQCRRSGRAIRWLWTNPD